MSRMPLGLGTSGRVRVSKVGTSWRADTSYRDWDGVVRRVQASGHSRTAAEQALQLALRNRVHVDDADLITRDSRLVDVAEKWFAELEGLSPSTVQGYRERLDKQVIPALGQVRLREITVGLVDRHLRAVKKNHSPAVAKMTKTVISGVCGLATRHDAMTTNPCRDVGRISVQPKKRPEALSVEQVRAFRLWLETDQKAIARDLPDLVALLAGTGMRIGEACALTWADVDFDEGTVSIRGTVLRLRGQGLVVTKPKSRAGERTIEIPGWCLDVLRRRRGLPSAPVFPAPLSGKLRDPSNTAHWMKEAMTSVGLDATSHVFRKTVASLLSDNQISPRLMADQLGHSRPSISLDIYLGRNRRVKGTALVLEQLALFDAATGDSSG